MKRCYLNQIIFLQLELIKFSPHVRNSHPISMCFIFQYTIDSIRNPICLQVLQGHFSTDIVLYQYSSVDTYLTVHTIMQIPGDLSSNQRDMKMSACWWRYNFVMLLWLIFKESFWLYILYLKKSKMLKQTTALNRVIYTYD